MLGVLPEIVDQLAALLDPRDAVGRIEDLENGGFIVFELRIAKRRNGLAIACFDPGADLRAVDFFKPKIRVVPGGIFDPLGAGGGLVTIRSCARRLGKAIEGWNATLTGCRRVTCCACTVATVKTTMAMAWCSSESETGATMSSVQMPSAACNVTAAANATAPASTGPSVLVLATRNACSNAPMKIT